MMGSEPWCQRRYQGCLAFYGCFQNTDLCSMNSEDEACKHFAGDTCRRGVVPFSSSGTISTNNIEGTSKSAVFPRLANSSDNLNLLDLTGYRSDILDFRYHVSIATYTDPSRWQDYGCYCPSALHNLHTQQWHCREERVRR